MLALPIVSVAFILLFASIKGSQGYLLDSANFQSKELYAFAASQNIASALDASPLNLSSATVLAQNLSNQYRVGVILVQPSEIAACNSSSSMCRLVTLSGSVYVLVVRYETTS